MFVKLFVSCGPRCETEAVLTCDLITFRPLNGVTGHPRHGFLLPTFSLYALPFRTYGQARDGQTDRQTTAINA